MNDTSKFGKTGDCNKLTDLLTIDYTEDESDELFSDDEQKKEIKCRSNVSQDTSVSSRSETPLLLLDSFGEITPTAVVPSAPLSLVPFLNKINEQWTSDLETPQAQSHTKLSSKTEETPKSEQRTPDNFTVKSDKIFSSSPVIVSKTTRRYPRRRRIFRSSVSIDPLAVTSNEDNTIMIDVEKLSSEDNTSVQDDINIATSTPCVDNILEDNKPNILSEIQDMSNNEELEEVKHVPDNLNTSTQEFFKNASFSDIDDLCFNNFDRQETDKITTQCNQSIGNITKQSNVEENTNIGFSTARGASINVSEQALLKAKELLKDAFEADEMQIENCDSFIKRNFKEQQDKHLPSCSFRFNNAFNTGKEVSYQSKPQFIEQAKNVDKLDVTNYKKSIMNKSFVKIDVAPSSLSIASVASTNISKGALSKAETLLMTESDKNNDENVLMRRGKKSSLNRNFIKPSNRASFSTANDKTTNISEKSLPQTKILFTEQFDTIVGTETFNKIDTSDKMQCDMKISNIGFYTAHGTSINISEQALSKAKALFEEQLKDPLEPIIAKETINDDNKMEIQEEKISKVGFHTAHGKPVNISERALTKANALFAEFDDTSTSNIAEKTGAHNKEKTTAAKIPNFQTARGTFINISEQALSKAKTLFATEFDDTFTPIIAEKASNCNKENKELEATVSNVGFQTARGTSINISEQALSKAKTLFAGELDDTSTTTVAQKISDCTKEGKELEATVSSFGFQTARGTSIDISKQALSKAKTLFAGELDDTSISTIAEKTSDCKKIGKELEATVSSFGFQTARGTSIDISEQALSKAKTLFAGELDDTPTTTVAEKISGCTKEGKQSESTVTSFGFQTARGTSIDISGQALSKAKTLFAGELNDTLTTIVAEKISGCIKEGKQPESTVSSFGFQTARGTSIDISEQALSKAKTLFVGELDDTLTTTVAEKISGCTKEGKQSESTVTSFGFQTARGTSIDISEQALSKAKTLFAGELEDTPTTVAEKISGNTKESKQSESTVSSFGFQTACGTSIDISKQALSKAKTLFAGELDDTLTTIVAEKITGCTKEGKQSESTVSNFRFQTARGASIDISEQALSKAKTLFVGELDDTLTTTVAEKISGCTKEGKQSESTVTSFGFQTARGTSINISEQAVSKAKALFEEELDNTATITEKINDCKKELGKELGAKVSNFGFQTACGTSISVSEQALSEAELLFADQLNDPMDIDIDNIDHNKENVKRRDSTNAYSEIQTANYQRITVPNDAALKKHALVSNCTEMENSPVVSNSLLQKRKLCEINSDESTPLSRNCASEMKKARLNNEFQGRELFPDSDVDMDNDEDLNSKGQASSIARFALGSPKNDIEEASESHAADSPILGRKRLALRKSSEYRRVKSQAAKVDKMDTENVPSNERVQKNASPRRSDDSESKTQPTTENKESSEYSDSQTMMIFIDESTKTLQDRLAAALEQEKTITAKRRCGSKQSVGHLYLYKQTNSNARLSLREISNGAPPVPRSYQELIDRRIQPSILSITAATAAHYELRCSDFYGDDMARSNVHGIEMGDNARLIMNENGHVGIWEFLRAFLASPGVDPNLVPARWVENHYRWIVWKLASMDRMKFGPAELPRALTPSRIMAQLKYRYDREIDRSQRSAIRRILEKDDVASKRMFLCVSSIVENNNVSVEVGRSPHVGIPKWKMELTDGWYSISACIDAGMLKGVSTGKIREGTKLVVSGAELLNCDQGCHPLEAPIDVCLKLHTNSTRRARWDAKLGYAPRPGPIPIRLRDVCPNGGSIGKMTIIVARVYPMLYHERTASGESIMRNAKCEEKAQSKYEQQCLSDIETFYAKAEKDFQGGDFSCEDDVQSADYETLSTGHASKKRHELLQELRQREERFKRELQSKLRESLPGPRQVSPLLKVRVCDGNADAILSIWSPSEEVVDAVKEGACVSLCNVAASGKRGNELQLTAGRCAVFKPGKMHDASYPVRVCTSLCEIADSEFAPPYGEFDTVGFVCWSGPAPYGMKDFEVVHLAHPKANSNESSYLSILFWHGIASYGYAEVLTVGSVVACSNLERRRATSWSIPVAYCTDRSTFTRNPRRNYLHESFGSLRDLIRNPIQYTEECTSELSVKLQKKSTPTRYESGKNTPIKMYDSTTSSVDKKLMDHASPLSTPKLGAGGSWNYIASRSSIQRRLERLQYYDKPPELSPIILTKSKRVSLDFRSPIRISDVSSNKDAPSTSNQSKDDMLSKQ